VIVARRTRSAYAAIPEYRRPIGATTWYESQVADRERNSLRAAVFDLGGADARGLSSLLADVREEWGPCEPAQLESVLAELVRDGDLERVPGGWVRAVDDEEDDA
jgi:hypothetical protein